MGGQEYGRILKTSCEETFNKFIKNVKLEYGVEMLEKDNVDQLTEVGQTIVEKTSGKTS